MRIAVWFNLPAGGARRALSYQIDGLLRQGHEVEFWSPALRDPDHHLPHRQVVRHELPLDDQHTPEGNRPPASPTPWGRISDLSNYHQEWLNTHNAFAKDCAEQINAGGFDVLLAHNCWRLHSPFVGRHVKIPSVLYLHEPRRPLYESLDGSVWLPLSKSDPAPSIKAKLKDHFDTQGRRLQIEAEARNAWSFDKILVNSYFSRESVMRAYGLNSTVCRLGIDSSKFHPTGMGKRPMVVAVGHVSPVKCPELLIQALARINFSGAELLMITHGVDPEYRDYCNSLAEKLGVSVRYEFQVTDERLTELMSEACVYGFAAKLEPFGLAPLEANACGTAAVSVAEGGPRESIVDGVNGFLVDRDPDAMASKIAPFLSDMSYATKIGQQAREHVVANWSLEEAERVLEAQLISVVDSSEQPSSGTKLNL